MNHIPVRAKSVKITDFRLSLRRQYKDLYHKFQLSFEHILHSIFQEEVHTKFSMPIVEIIQPNVIPQEDQCTLFICFSVPFA